MTQGRDEGKVTAFFQEDHRQIDAIYASIDFASVKGLAALQEFDRRLERHIGWEESVLFPEVAEREPGLGQGPIRVMFMEHVQIRDHKKRALEAMAQGDFVASRKSAQAMVNVLKEHNFKEEQILYPACDQLFTDAETVALLSKLKK